MESQKQHVVCCRYLRDREQRVKIDNLKAEWLHTGKGSAQGSILGPFCITNDVLYELSDTVDIYNCADGNTLVCAGYVCRDALMSNVNNVMSYHGSNIIT